MDGLDDDWCPDAYGDGAARRILGPPCEAREACRPLRLSLTASCLWAGACSAWFEVSFLSGRSPPSMLRLARHAEKPWRWAALLRSQWAALADLCYATMHFRGM